MVYDFDSIQSLLTEELRRRLKDNPGYSLRAFARNLKLSPGALSEILKGRRDLPLRSVQSVAKAIGMNAPEAKHLLKLAQNAKAGSELVPAPATDQRVISDQIFSLVSEWYHFAILNLLETEKAEWKDSWIAARLNISRAQAKMAMDLLAKFGLVVKKNGAVKGGTDHILTANDVPSAAIRSYHRQILMKAANALDTQEVTEREISGIGMPIDPDLLPKIKKDIAEFQDQMLAKYSRGKKKEVYFMEMALFKLTVGENK